MSIASPISPPSPKSKQTRKSYVSGTSFRSYHKNSIVSSKSKDGSPLRSSVGGSKKRYGVIYGSPDKIKSNSKILNKTDESINKS